MAEKRWYLDMVAEPVVPAWTNTHAYETNGAELERAILKGFADGSKLEQPFEKVFTFKEHGEFFRGALTMASLRYTDDFYELLKRYGTIKVTLSKDLREDK